MSNKPLTDAEKQTLFHARMKSKNHSFIHLPLPDEIIHAIDRFKNSNKLDSRTKAITQIVHAALIEDSQ